MYPYLVESKSFSVGLFQLSDGRFQMIKQGNLSKFISGVDYILMEDKLADFLSDLDIPQVEFKDAVVWNRKLDKEFHNYKQIIVKKHITEEKFEHLDLRGLQIYIFGWQHLFVSPKLKEVLQYANFDYLEFSEGLSNFVA